jgi:hypothetical protein
MPTKIEARMVEAPGGGVMRHVNPRHVPDQHWTNARNVRFRTGGSTVRSTDGYQRVDNTIRAEPLQALWWYVDPLGVQPETLVQISTTGAFQGLGGARTSLVQFPAARTLDDVVTVDQYKEHLLWADGKDVYTWPGTGPAIPLGVAGVGGAATQAPIGKLVEIHKDHVLLGNITVDPKAPGPKPWRVNHSAEGAPFDWTSDVAGFVDFLDDSTGITALKVLGDHAIVHKPNRLSRMIFVGPPDYYITESIPADEGSISARGAISVGSYQFYPGHTNIFRLGSFAEPIGDAIWPEIAAAIDWPQAHLTYAYRRDAWDEICWKFPTRGVAQPNLTAVYNYRDQSWSLTDHDPGTCYTQVPSNALKSTQFDDDAALVSPPPVRDVFGQIGGQIHVYTGRNADGLPFHAWVESKHFSDVLNPARIVAVPIYATGTGTLEVTVRAAMDARVPMPAWPVPRPLALDPPQYRPWVNVREYGRLWQIRMESNALNTEWEVAAYGAAVIPGGFAR